MQRLSCPVCHGRNPERAHLHLFRVMTFGNEDASERLRSVIFGGEILDGSRLLIRCVEQLAVYSGSAFAGVFRHSSDSQAAPAVGASEDELQGADFALLALLLRLHDPSLQTTHVTVNSLPFDGAPVNRRTQARASRFVTCFKFSTNSCFLRHRQSVSCRKTPRKSARLPVP